MDTPADSPAILIGLERHRTVLRAVALDVAGRRLATGSGLEPIPTLAALATELGAAAAQVAGIGFAGSARQASAAEHLVRPGRNPRRWLPSAARDALALGAIPAIDTALASGDDRFDLATRAWNDAVLEVLGIDPRLLPPAVPPGARIGSLSDAAADATGLPAGIALAAPTDRHAAAALAHAITTPLHLLVLEGDAAEWVATFPEDRRIAVPDLPDRGLRLHVAPGCALLFGPIDRTHRLADARTALDDDIDLPADDPATVVTDPVAGAATGAALLAGMAAGEYVDLASARRVAVAIHPPRPASAP